MQQAQYVRRFAHGICESHFEDLDESLPPVGFAPPGTPLNEAGLLLTTKALGRARPDGRWEPAS